MSKKIEKRRYSDRKEYLKTAVKDRRKKIKKMAVEYKGGKCQICSYDKCIEALEFHHLDPNKKDFGIASKGVTRSWAKVKAELDKCIMLCANCHREVHVGLIFPSSSMAERSAVEVTGK
jgi:5-methylcytosine-specific restriction endonuclease McrA